MKDQRWPCDYQTIREEFASSRREEQRGMDGVNRSYGNDYLAMETSVPLDAYQREELAPSWCTQLDTVGMQPHAREYLERNVSCMRSDRKFEMISGQMLDYAPGIQFTDMP